MKLTPFGFVNRAEIFVKEALSLPPKGGGEWSTQRVVNFVDHTGSLHILLRSGEGEPKPTAVLNTRLTGGPRDGGIQGWAEFPTTGTRHAFVLRETDSDRAMEEIFEIVEKALFQIPEWDNSATLHRPEPKPRVFEPLIPEIQKPLEEALPGEPPLAEVPVEPAAPEAGKPEAPSDMQAMVDSLLSPDSFDEPPVAASEEPIKSKNEESNDSAPAAEESPKTAKKPGRGRKAKA